jgi:hypothetical protein
VPCTRISGRPDPAENTAIGVPSRAMTRLVGASGKGAGTRRA